MLWVVRVSLKAFFYSEIKLEKFSKKWKKLEKYGTILMFVLGVSGKSADYTALGGIRYDGKRI